MRPFLLHSLLSPSVFDSRVFPKVNCRLWPKHKLAHLPCKITRGNVQTMRRLTPAVRQNMVPWLLPGGDKMAARPLAARPVTGGIRGDARAGVRNRARGWETGFAVSQVFSEELLAVLTG